MERTTRLALYQREYRKMISIKTADERAAKKRERAHQARIRQRLTKYKYDAIKLRGLEWGLAEHEARRILASPCHYCGASSAYGIDRKYNHIGYTLVNCVPCCTFCNMAKRTHSYEEFQAHLLRISLFVNNKIAIWLTIGWQRSRPLSHDALNKTPFQPRYQTWMSDRRNLPRSKTHWGWSATRASHGPTVSSWPVSPKTFAAASRSLNL